MKAKYLGAPTADDDGPRRVSYVGVNFPRGVFVDASLIQGKPLEKLKAHPNFEVSDEALTDADHAAAEAVNGPASTGDLASGEKSGAGDDKATVIAKLEALQAKHPEVAFQPNWGLKRLKEALEGAEFEFGED